MIKFKVGDLIKCINTTYADNLKEGTIYDVAYVHSNCVGIIDESGKLAEYSISRFEIEENAESRTARALSFTPIDITLKIRTREDLESLADRLVLYYGEELVKMVGYRQLSTAQLLDRIYSFVKVLNT